MKGNTVLHRALEKLPPYDPRKSMEQKEESKNMSASSTVKLTKGYKEAVEKIKKLEAQVKEANTIIKKASAMDTIGDCVDVNKKANQYFLKHPWAITEEG